MDLDRRIYGLNRSDLIILAARPGMGKTSFAMNIVTNVGKKYQDTSIAVFSLEMSKEQIVSRMISSEASLTSDAMKTGTILQKSGRISAGLRTCFQGSTFTLTTRRESRWRR